MATKSKVNGKTINLMEKPSFGIKMEITTMGTGKTAKLMVKDSINLKTEVVI